MEALKEKEQLLDSEVAEMKRRLEQIQQYFKEHCTHNHRLKELWIKVILSALQGYENVDNPPKQWESKIQSCTQNRTGGNVS